MALAPSSLALPHRPFRLGAGTGLALAIALLIAVILYAIARAAGRAPPSSAAAPDIVHLLEMTSIQAGLSTILSLIVGVGLAWALNRLDFPGRRIVIGFFAAAIVTPGIIIAFGLLAVWGRAGWINGLAHALVGGSLEFPIFGLAGILFAHVILDAAFAARVLLARLDTIPLSRLRIGQSLALSPWRRFAIIDWPAMAGTLPGLAAIIFLLAFTSFPIVLLLGGGPANQTLEVAIYAAVRLDFDLNAAVTLALIQIGVCALIIVAAAAFAPVPAGFGSPRTQTWHDHPGARALQWAILVVGLLGFALPLLAVLAGGLNTGILALFQQAAFWIATTTSLGIAIASALLTLALALGLAMARANATSTLARIGLAAPAYAYLAVPAVVLALGFFLLVRSFSIAPERAGPVVVVIGNTLLSLPFAIATLAPPLEAIARRDGRLIASLGLSGWRQFAAIEWPLMGHDIGIVLALGFCFSLGDLGVISLFGTENFMTLPLMLVRAMGAYRNADAGAIAAIMLIATIVAFVGLPRLLEKLAHADP